MQLQQIIGLLVVSASIASFAVAGCTQTVEPETQTPQVETSTPQVEAETATPQIQLDVPYVPTPNEVVAEMLRIGGVKGNDILYDLGSGDGRIVITAAQKFATRGVGVDLSPQRVKEANANAQKAGVTDRVQFRQQDLFQTNLSEATVVTLYLLPEVNLKLRPKLLKELKPGTRIVSHDFDMGDWKPESVLQVQGPTRQHTLYYWVVPKEIPPNLR